MSRVESVIDIALKDDVTATAGRVAAALQKLEAREKSLDAALKGSGTTDRFQGRLQSIKATETQIEAAGRAWKQYAEAEGLAAKAGDWTKTQAAGVREFERTQIAALRAIQKEDKLTADANRRLTEALERGHGRAAAAAEHGARRTAAAHRSGGGHGDTSTLSGIASLYAAQTFEHMAEGVLERYQEFDNQRRYAKAVMGLTDEQQKPLVEQAIRGGATSRFNDVAWLEGQREFAARGYQTDQVLAFTKVAATLGAAFDKTLPESVTLIEGALLGFSKDTSTYAKAVQSAQRTADIQVKASKISGMSAEDIQALYARGASPAKMAGLTEEQMLTFGGVLKKTGLGGEEAATAFRALAKNLVSPTHEAITAMRANGINFGSYQHAPKAMDADGFASMVAQNYGVQLSAAARAGIGRIFSDPKLLGDPSKFTPAVTQFLQGALGGKDAKSLKSIAGLAKQYRDASVSGVDTVKLLTDMMVAMSKNKGLANAVFGSKMGGPIYAALGNPEVFNGLLDQITNHSEGYAQKVGEGRSEGYDGATKIFQSAVASLESRIGQAWDGGGNGGLLTSGVRTASEVIAALSELPAPALRAATELGAVAAGAAALKGFDLLKGGFGLTTSATSLEAAATSLEGAATRLSAAASEEGLAGAVPGGAVRRAEGALAREGEAIAKGSLVVETLEVAATGAATLSVGTIALAGVAAVALVDALSHAAPKPRASDRPDFGDSSVKMRLPEAARPVSPLVQMLPPQPNEGRREAPALRKTDLPGHYAPGRGNVTNYILDGPFRPTALMLDERIDPMRLDTQPRAQLPLGWLPDRPLPRFGDVPRVEASAFPDGVPGPVTANTQPPPERPAWRPPAEQNVPPNSDGNALRRADEGPGPAPRAVSPAPSSTATNFQTVSAALPAPAAPPALPAPAARDPWLEGERPAIEHRSEQAVQAFRRDPEGARGNAMLEHFAPQVDTSAIDAAQQKAEAAGQAMRAALGITATATAMVDTSGIDAAIAKARAFIDVMEQAGRVASSAPSRIDGAGGTPSNGYRSFHPASAGHTTV